STSQSRLVSAIASAETSHIATLQPSATSWRASSRPIPVPPPVMTAILPAKSFMASPTYDCLRFSLNALGVYHLRPPGKARLAYGLTSRPRSHQALFSFRSSVKTVDQTTTESSIAQPREHLPDADDFLMWPPCLQSYGYRIVDRLFATRTIPRSERPLAIPRGRELRPTYTIDGERRTIEQLMD